MKHDWQSVPMPRGIAARPRDARGFPITFVTLIGSDGRPDFTVIDAQRIVDCIRGSLCGLCGLEYEVGKEIAFIGGPLSCQHSNFLDPPMHVECAKYAMKVCPHIAIDTSRYAKPRESREGEALAFFEGVSPDRPEKFGLYVTRTHQIADAGGQPVFLAGPGEITWQEEVA